MAAWRGVIMDGGRAEKISTILRNYLGPGGADSVYEEVDCFSKFKRTRLTMDVFPVEFGSLRRKAAFPEACVPAPRIGMRHLCRVGQRARRVELSGSPASNEATSLSLRGGCRRAHLAWRAGRHS